MTRRSFCFLFGAGIAAAALGVGPSNDALTYDKLVDLVQAIDPDYISRFVTITEGMREEFAINWSDVLYASGFGSQGLRVVPGRLCRSEAKRIIVSS